MPANPDDDRTSTKLRPTVPAFKAPPRRPIPADVPLAEDENLTLPPALSSPATARDVGAGDSSDAYRAPSTPSPGAASARTNISDTDERPAADPKATIALMIGLLGALFAGVGILTRVRRGYRLRQPTKRDLRDMAEPLASIALRHLPAALINGDLADAAAVAAALSSWAEAGPILEPSDVDAGVPTNLQGGDTHVESYS